MPAFPGGGPWFGAGGRRTFGSEVLPSEEELIGELMAVGSTAPVQSLQYSGL